MRRHLRPQQQEIKLPHVGEGEDADLVVGEVRMVRRARMRHQMMPYHLTAATHLP